jgi:DNA-directed RNA polymerase specialized sigma24 family protein
MIEADRQMQVDQSQPSDFERLLSWLDADREKAGEKYEQIRQNLVDYFRRRGVIDPFSLTDEVFVRVTKRVAEVAQKFVGSPSYYFLGVARRVIAEYWRRPLEQELADTESISFNADAAQLRESAFASLEECWARLSETERSFLFRYCVERPPVKLSVSREQLAAEIGSNLNAIRVMAHRLKQRVKRCIENLMRQR